jgi:hypothetical protein
MDFPNGGALDTAAWAKESDTVEERFVSALLGTTRWLGPNLRGGPGQRGKRFRQRHEAAERELAQAREIRRAAEISLRQARTALISLDVE